MKKIQTYLAVSVCGTENKFCRNVSKKSVIFHVYILFTFYNMFVQMLFISVVAVFYLLAFWGHAILVGKF